METYGEPVVGVRSHNGRVLCTECFHSWYGRNGVAEPATGYVHHCERCLRALKSATYVDGSASYFPPEVVKVCTRRDGSLDLNKLSHLLSSHPW